MSPPTSITPTARIPTASSTHAIAASANRPATLPRNRPIIRSGPGTSRPVPDAAHRRDVARLFGAVAELVAEPPDVRIDRPIQDVALAEAVERVQQLFAREHPAVGLEERGQQPELGGRQGHDVSVDRGLVALSIDRQVAQPQRLAPARGVGAGRRSGEHAPDPEHELCR